jgi:hypothetical protein
METTIIAKLAAFFWESIKWLGAALLGLLVWIWKRQDAELKSLKITVETMHSNYQSEIKKEADRIRLEVKCDHEKIEEKVIDAMKDIHENMRDDLHNCNEGLMTEIRDLRGFLMNHLERRGNPRGE